MTDGPPSVALRFEILGPVRAYRDGQPVDLGSRLQQAVLAILLLRTGKPVPIERLVSALWDGDPPPNGVDVVQRCIGGLRKALDPERTSLLTLTDGGYLLRVDERSIDAAQFRMALAQARAEHQTGNLDTAVVAVHQVLGLWQDEPLAGLTGAVFESTRARLKQEHATASQLLATPTPPPPVAAEPAPTRIEPAPTRIEAPAPAPTRVEPAPTRVEMPPTRVETPPTRAEMPPTRIEPAAAATQRVEPAAKSEYPEAVDPWAGHDLFPPDPMSIL
ncbi:winged helix-turn-helix domain-containing protein [Actinoplanes sp. L3-i22]|uniref:AfsR/SARP family transcriptional regulator n=1 Tax=Actinoplanes sp. L3-i22 TaxID=2836373 RepID=UPI001C7723C0|nr:winged helix-turn-helix domain-containing protein [Actinoplanes sp. L3-i22]BCY08681.1 hypothetical protein L3i22_037690 [Actinoplanes sp. L3-i22]